MSHIFHSLDLYTSVFVTVSVLSVNDIVCRSLLLFSTFDSATPSLIYMFMKSYEGPDPI